MRGGTAGLEEAMTRKCKSRCGEDRHGECTDLACWVTRLDASQRQAYAADIQGQIKMLDLILEIVASAKRQGRLHYGPDGNAFCSHELPKGDESMPGEGAGNPLF